eukprot:4528463-Pyramimonas_sp.AAC.1
MLTSAWPMKMRHMRSKSLVLATFSRTSSQAGAWSFEQHASGLASGSCFAARLTVMFWCLLGPSSSSATGLCGLRSSP